MTPLWKYSWWEGEADHRPLRAILASDWLLLLGIATVALLLMFGCSTPFAAATSVSLLLVNFRSVILAVGIVWLVNQFIGFTLFNFPMTPNSFAWGGAILLCGIFGGICASIVTDCLKLGRIGQTFVAFHVTLFCYQIGYMFSSLFLNENYDAYTVSILLQVYRDELISLTILLLLVWLSLYIERRRTRIT